MVEDRVSIGGIVTRYFSAVRPFSYLIFDGVFDRYPKQDGSRWPGLEFINHQSRAG